MNNPYTLTDNDVNALRQILQTEHDDAMNNRTEGETYPVNNSDLAHACKVELPRDLPKNERKACEAYIDECIFNSEDLERELADD